MISGKSVQKSAVTCLVWPSTQSNYVAGLADGKVRGRWTSHVSHLSSHMAAGEIWSGEREQDPHSLLLRILCRVPGCQVCI